ncbi:MAG TPA: serpin family protein [Rhabdochlamydiaceae bacterium]|nr:serpin family protein [Rhabdochlamydiaceae bacterium]
MLAWNPSCLNAKAIPNVIHKSVLGNAGAADLQQALPAPKQGMCKHMSDTGGCKDEDAGAAQNRFVNHVRYKNSEEKQDQTKELIKDISEFSFSLFSSVNEPSNNILFSPYSIYSCLSMVYAGTRGETASEMQTALSLNVNQKKLPGASAKLANMLKSKETEAGGSYEMHLANGLWLDMDTFVLSDFRHIAENEYHAAVQSLDFSKTDLAINTINDWISGQTYGKISKILQEGDVDGSTRVLLTNAVYFKGSWQKPFDPKATKTSPFFSSPEASTDVKMMENTSHFSYFENDSMQMLSLPFKGKTAENSQLACLILLPKSTQMTDLEKALTVSNIEESISQLKSQNVHVQLPKINLKMRMELNPALQALGIKLAFTKDGDFSGIDGMRDLFLSKVIHDTFFSLDEAGVTAAAATAASINATAVLEKNPPIEFIANHPFIFLIADLNYKTVLFMGKFQRP